MVLNIKNLKTIYYNNINSFLGPNGYNLENQTNISVKIKPLQLSNDMPFFLPYEKTKDCLFLKFSIEDTRHIMFKNNLVHKALKNLVNTNTKYK